MSGRTLVVVLLLVASVAAWFTLRGGADVDPGRVPGSRTANEDPAQAVGGVAEPATSEMGRAAVLGEDGVERTAVTSTARGAATAGVSLRGRLVDPRGAPRAGVKVALPSWQAPEGFEVTGMPALAAGNSGKRSEVTTKQDGTFVVALGADRQGSLEILDDDLVFRSDSPWLDGRKGDQDLGDIVVVRSGALQGVVQDEQGRPVGGVKVSATLGLLAFGTVSTDMTGEDGRFAVGKLRPGSWNLRTASDRFQPTVQEITLKPEERRLDLVVVVRPGQAVAGQVVDDRGVPVADCKVASKRKEVRGGMDIERFASDEAATTDAQGYFTLSGLSGSTATVRAFGRGHTDAVARDVRVGTGNLLLRVERLAEVHGRLQGIDGGGIADSMVRAMPAGRIGEADFETLQMGEPAVAKTAADGSFRITNVRPGITSFVADGREHRPARLAGLAVLPGQVVEGVRLVADAGATATVKVTDQRGKPVAAATVRVQRPKPNDGRDGGFTSRVRSVEADVDDQDTQMRFGGDDDDFGSAKTDEAGIARVRGLPEGAAVVRASDTDHAEAVPRNVNLPKAGAVEVTVILRDPGFAEVVVKGVDGVPVAGAAVLVSGSPDASSGERRGTTDAQGAARIGPLAPGSYTAQLARTPGTVQHDNVMFSFDAESTAIAGTERPFQIVAGETTRVEILRPVLTHVHGVVTGIDGPVAGCSIELERGGEGFGMPGFGERHAETDAEGRYRFDDVESGKYTVVYGMQEQVVKSRADLDVPANAPEYRLDLVVRSGKVRVQACAKGSGDPIEGAEVEVRRETASTGGPALRQRMVMVAISTDDDGGGATSMTIGAPRVLTGADGWAEIDNVPVGTYSIHVRHDDCAPVEKAGQIVIDRQTTDCGRVELDRAGIVRGRVIGADGSPVSMATVQCRSVDTPEWGESEIARDGAFQFSGRQPGRHVLRARSMGGSRAANPGPEVEVEVIAGEVTTTEVRLPAK